MNPGQFQVQGLISAIQTPRQRLIRFPTHQHIGVRDFLRPAACLVNGIDRADQLEIFRIQSRAQFGRRPHVVFAFHAFAVSIQGAIKPATGVAPFTLHEIDNAQRSAFQSRTIGRRGIDKRLVGPRKVPANCALS